jgi:hypothetical protein
MGAAQASLEDMVYAMEADETARIVKEHKLPGAQPEKSGTNIFTVTIMRGQCILGKGLSKAADGFVVVVAGGERIFKTRTVLGAEDPRW